MESGSFISYVVVIFITVVIVSIITENSVISRIQCSEGVQFVGGKCRLKQGYSKIDSDPLDKKFVIP